MFEKKWDKGQYVLMPFVSNLNGQGLHYNDMLIYLSLRSFNNRQKGCFPSQQAIAKKAGVSKYYIIDSIARLERTGVIWVKRSEKKHKPNHYFFEELVCPLKVPIAFFKITDLTAHEKGMLLCLLRLLIPGSRSTIKDISKDLGLTAQQIYKQYQGLLDKGYIKEELIKKRKKRTLDYDKVDWTFGNNLSENVAERQAKLTLKVG